MDWVVEVIVVVLVVVFIVVEVVAGSSQKEQPEAIQETQKSDSMNEWKCLYSITQTKKNQREKGNSFNMISINYTKSID